VFVTSERAQLKDHICQLWADVGVTLIKYITIPTKKSRTLFAENTGRSGQRTRTARNFGTYIANEGHLIFLCHVVP